MLVKKNASRPLHFPFRCKWVFWVVRELALLPPPFSISSFTNWLAKEIEEWQVSLKISGQKLGSIVAAFVANRIGPLPLALLIIMHLR